jgi:hypothetical protein
MLLQATLICKPLAAFSASMGLCGVRKMHCLVPLQLIPADVTIAAGSTDEWFQAGLVGGNVTLQVVAVPKAPGTAGTLIVLAASAGGGVLFLHCASRWLASCPKFS